MADALTAKEIKAKVDAAINNITAEREKPVRADLAVGQNLQNRMDSLPGAGYDYQGSNGPVNMDQLARNISTERHQLDALEKEGNAARIKAERIVLGSHVTNPEAVAKLIEHTAMEYQAGLGAFKVAEANENKLHSPSAGGKKSTGQHLE